MKTNALLLALITGMFCDTVCIAQPSSPAECTNCLFLNSWSFLDTNNWLSDAGYSPVAFSNIVSVPGVGGGNWLVLDTSNTAPAFLFYNIVETNKDSTTFTNIALSEGSEGTISLWFSPVGWSSTNQSGSGPGTWANLISVGEYGTNGSSWFAWYLSGDGCTAYLASMTNGGSPAVYLSAPVSLLATNWYNFVVTYGPTNSAFYTNGVLVTNGTGVEYWPGPDATFFAIGSDTNGVFQGQGNFSLLETYNYQLDPGTIRGFFGMYSIFYGLAETNGDYDYSPDIVQAPSTNSDAPYYDAVTGPGFLVANGTSATYPSSSNVWITNYSATAVSSNVVNLDFAIAGGTNGVPYDVFATAAFADPVTNSTWYWMGQAYRGTNYILPITNSPAPGNAFIILGTPQDSDHDGLTDAYELFVTHTNPDNPDTSGDGISDGWKVVLGLNPLVNYNTQTNAYSNYSYDSTDWLTGITGVRTGSVALDAEGNVLSVSQ